VIAVKRRPGGRVFAAVDGGMSDSPRAALYGASYTFAVAGDAGHSPPSAGLAAMA
jgi:diaminopimelate decarboxylase